MDFQIMVEVQQQKTTLKKAKLPWPSFKKTKKMFSLLKLIKKCFRKTNISMKDMCLQNSIESNFDERVVHEIPSSLIELTKEDKKILEYILMSTYLDEYLL